MNEPVRQQAPEPVTDRRPWGGYTTYAQNELCSVKILWVEPGKRLSLQSHTGRSELWTVIEGKLGVERDGERHELSPGEQIFLPLGCKHRAFGLDEPARWLEIMFGHYDENDITRYEDDFGRS